MSRFFVSPPTAEAPTRGVMDIDAWSAPEIVPLVPCAHRQNRLPESRYGHQPKLKHKSTSPQHTTVPSKRAKPAHRKSILPPPPPHPKSHESKCSILQAGCSEQDAQTKMLLLIVQSHRISVPIKVTASYQAELNRRESCSLQRQQSQTLVRLCLDTAPLRRGRSASSAPVPPPQPNSLPPTESTPTLLEPTHAHTSTPFASMAEEPYSHSPESSSSHTLSSSLAGRRRTFSNSLNLSVTVSTEGGTGILLPGPLFPPAKLETAVEVPSSTEEEVLELQSPPSEASPIPSPNVSEPLQAPQAPAHGQVCRKEANWEHKTLYGVHIVSGGWFSKCRGCGQLTASEHQTLTREGVPFCGECIKQLAHLPDVDRTVAELQMLNIHRGWGHLGV